VHNRYGTLKLVGGMSRDGNLDASLGHPQVLDLTGASMSAILHPWVTPAPDLHKTGFGCEFLLTPVRYMKITYISAQSTILRPCLGLLVSPSSAKKRCKRHQTPRLFPVGLDNASPFLHKICNKPAAGSDQLLAAYP
jgi:hypothetical protein